MGRGGDSAAQAQAHVGRRRRRGGLFGGGKVKLAEGATRSVKRSFTDDIEAWKASERAFVDAAIADLNRVTREHAASNEGWAEYLQFTAETPCYSSDNNYWARRQLERNGVDTDGLVLSESMWAKLGRRVKAEYANPHGRSESRRDLRYGYDRKRDWDPRYAVEQMKPLGMVTSTVTLKDAAGNPILDAHGKPKKKRISFWPEGKPRIYGTFVAYHQDATEAIDGGTPTPLPTEPWADATGTDEDAEKMLADLETHTLPELGLKLERVEGLEGRSAAALSRNIVDERVIAVDTSRPIASQAADVLGVICDQTVTLKEGATDEDRKRARASSASAKHVIASLYGLDSAQQDFPYVAELAQTDDGIRSLNGEIRRRVNRVLNQLDPRMRELARSQGAKKRGKGKAAKPAKRQPAGAAA